MNRFATSLCGAALALAALGQPAAAQISDDVVRIGVLTDLSGPYADSGGRGSVAAAEMAAKDFGGKVRGKPVEIVSADHQNKPDVGAAVARQWYDRDGVDLVIDLSNSGVSQRVIEFMINTQGNASSAAPQPVTVARLSEESAEIASGLNPGDRIVALGAHLLKAGQKVRPASASMAEAGR